MLLGGTNFLLKCFAYQIKYLNCMLLPLTDIHKILTLIIMTATTKGTATHPRKNVANANVAIGRQMRKNKEPNLTFSRFNGKMDRVSILVSLCLVCFIVYLLYSQISLVIESLNHTLSNSANQALLLIPFIVLILLIGLFSITHRRK